MANSAERNTRGELPSCAYLVRREEHGIYIDDLDRRIGYFKPKSGQWLMLQGDESPFDEDALIGPEWGSQLDRIAKDAKESAPPSLKG
jgi:hypothetical protein